MFLEEGYSMPPAPWSLNREAYLPDKLTYQDVRWWPVLLTVAYFQCLQDWAEKCNPLGNPDFCPLAESVRESRQAICEFVNITQEDVIEGLKIEEPEGGQWPSPTTIFSQVLVPLANRHGSEESSAQPKERAVKCAPPPLRLEWEDCYMLVIASLMRQLTIGPGGNNVRRGRNLLQSHCRVAIFLPCCPALPIERGTTSMDLNASSTAPTIEDITGQEYEANWNLPLGKWVTTHHCMTEHSQYPLLGRQLTAWTFPL